MDPPPSPIYLPRHPFTLACVRHGESEANAARGGTHERGTDTPLTALGRQQARDLKPHLQRLDVTHVGSSDLRRAIGTREELFDDAQGRVRILPDDMRLRELSRGDDAHSGFPLRLRQRMNALPGGLYRSPNGQSMADVATLYCEWVLDMAIRHEDDEGVRGFRPLLVGHGNGIKALFAAVTGADHRSLGELRNTSVTLIGYDPSRREEGRPPFFGLAYNLTPHLEIDLRAFRP